MQGHAIEKRVPAEGTVRRALLNCIMDLHNSNRAPSRHAVSTETGLKLSVVDDHIKRLKDDGIIRLVVNGIFEPCEIEEDRAVSFTFVPKGKVKLEIGDIVVELTMREARTIAMGSAGVSLLFTR